MNKIVPLVIILGFLTCVVSTSAADVQPRVEIMTSREVINIYAFYDLGTQMVCYVTTQSISCTPSKNVNLKPWFKLKSRYEEQELKIPTIFYLSPHELKEELTPQNKPEEEQKEEKDEKL